MTEIFAHRGFSSEYPENTLPAFSAALEFADGLELDVQLSKDQQLVVIHDETLERTTNGQGFVADYTAAQLQTFNAGAHFAKNPLTTQIPTFKEVLALLIRQNFQGTLNIELKTDIIHYQGIEAILLDLLQEYRLDFPIIFSSFYLPTLEKLAQLYPAGNYAYIFRNETDKVLLTEETSFLTAMHPKIVWLRKHQQFFTNEAPKKNWLKRKTPEKVTITKPQRFWTVNEEADLKLCFANQVAGIFTDNPRFAREVQAKMYG
ncbi:glycerophosphodiester phosphodiesterase family protein [Enterococcus sp. LJL90]